MDEPYFSLIRHQRKINEIYDDITSRQAQQIDFNYDRVESTRDAHKIDQFWMRHESEHCLKDRAFEGRQAVKVLGDLVENTKVELAHVTEFGTRCEEILNTLFEIEKIMVACTGARKPKSSAMEDIVDEIMKEEIDWVKKYVDATNEIAKITFDKKFALNSILSAISLDTERKLESANLDEDQTDVEPSQTSFKIDPLRVPKGSSSIEKWRGDIEKFIKSSEQVMESSKADREKWSKIRFKNFQSIYEQLLKTEALMRTHCEQFRRELNALNWNRNSLTTAMAKLYKNIEDTENSLLELRYSTKLVETNLENRTYRPGTELVEDKAQAQLRMERLSLDRNEMELKRQLGMAKCMYNDYEKAILDLDAGMETIKNAIQVNQTLLNEREKLWKLVNMIL